MNFGRSTQAITMGALFSAVILAISMGLIVFKSDESGGFGLNESDFWWLAAMFGLIFGLVSGGLLSGLVVKYKLSPLKAVISGFFYGLFLVALIAYILGGGWSDSISYALTSIITVETFTAFFVSLFINRKNNSTLKIGS